VISVRRARLDDVDFLFELVNHEDVQPFLGGRAARDRDELAAEVVRSESDPTSYGRFVIEVDGERAGVMGFEVENRRSRIARLERLAVHPDYRGRRVADEAARLFQRHLFEELGYHRLQLEIYGFNERAMAHAERAGFVREGVKRKAYLRHGDWADGVLYGMLWEDLGLGAVLHDHVDRFNAGVRTGDWSSMIEGFDDRAEMEFRGIAVGPFHGKESIAQAYRDQPPDDELLVLEERARDGRIEARYAWRAEPDVAAGELLITAEDGLIRTLVITFDRAVAWE
jgi:RimJ/RimL family protein N-acetyltransferase